MYPEVFLKYAEHDKTYGDVSVLPTHVFFYGMQSGTEITLPVIDGRQVIIRYLAASEADEEGMCRVFFEVNGQPQTVIIHDTRVAYETHGAEKADDANPGHVAAPMPGLVVDVEVSPGQKVHRGDTLVLLEAMKMQTAIPAERDGLVKRVVVKLDHVVNAGDLLLEMEVEE